MKYVRSKEKKENIFTKALQMPIATILSRKSNQTRVSTAVIFDNMRPWGSV